MSNLDDDLSRVAVAVQITDNPAFGSDPVNAVARQIALLGVPGQVIDGASLGHPGWVLARTLGACWDETALRYDAEDDELVSDVPLALVRDHLHRVFQAVAMAGDLSDLAGTDFDPEHPSAHGAGATAVLVGPTGDHMYGVLSSGLEASLRWRTFGNRDIVELVEADEDLVMTSGGLEAVSEAIGRPPVVVLRRHGDLSSVALLRKGKVITAKVWEPAWRAIELELDDDDLARTVAEALEGRGAEPAQFASHLGLDVGAAMNLRAMFLRSEPDFVELAEILGLPLESAQILEGDPAMADRPGFTLVEPKPIFSAFKAEMGRVPEGKGLGARIQRDAVEGAPWYHASNAIWLIGCVAFTVDAFRGGSPWWLGVLASVLGALTVIEFFVRRRARRRRAKQPADAPHSP